MLRPEPLPYLALSYMQRGINKTHASNLELCAHSSPLVSSTQPKPRNTPAGGMVGTDIRWLVRDLGGRRSRCPALAAGPALRCGKVQFGDRIGGELKGGKTQQLP